MPYIKSTSKVGVGGIAVISLNRHNYSDVTIPVSSKILGNNIIAISRLPHCSPIIFVLANYCKHSAVV